MRFPYFADARDAHPIGFYELNPFPGCNQIVVSNHAYIKPECRGHGHGKMAHQERINTMRELGYDYAICTVVSTNEVQINILQRWGWKELDSFLNKETNNIVRIFGRKIYPAT